MSLTWEMSLLCVLNSLQAWPDARSDLSASAPGLSARLRPQGDSGTRWICCGPGRSAAGAVWKLVCKKEEKGV